MHVGIGSILMHTDAIDLRKGDFSQPCIRSVNSCIGISNSYKCYSKDFRGSEMYNTLALWVDMILK